MQRAMAMPNPLDPIPSSPLPAPDFATLGEVGAAVPNQLLDDAVRGFNGYFTRRKRGNISPLPPTFGLALHEFTPNVTFLTTVTDLTQLADPLMVWRRVSPQERHQKYGAGYVEDIAGTSPTTCDKGN